MAVGRPRPVSWLDGGAGALGWVSLGPREDFERLERRGSGPADECRLAVVLGSRSAAADGRAASPGRGIASP